MLSSVDSWTMFFKVLSSVDGTTYGTLLALANDVNSKQEEMPVQVHIYIDW